MAGASGWRWYASCAPIETNFHPVKPGDVQHSYIFETSDGVELLADGLVQIDEILFVFPSQYEITRVKAVGKCIFGSGSFAWHDGASTIFGSFSYGLSRNLSCEIPQIIGPCFASKPIGQNEPNFLSNSRNTCIDTAIWCIFTKRRIRTRDAVATVLAETSLSGWLGASERTPHLRTWFESGRASGGAPKRRVAPKGCEAFTPAPIPAADPRQKNWA